MKQIWSIFIKKCEGKNTLQSRGEVNAELKKVNRIIHFKAYNIHSKLFLDFGM